MNEIKAAYRKLALVHHPDRGGNEEKMKEVNEAYEFLVKNKERYDQNFKPARPQVRDYGFTIIVGGMGGWNNSGTTATATMGTGWTF